MVSVFLALVIWLTPQAAAEPRLRLPELLMRHKVITRVLPEYPAMARNFGVGGDVRLNVVISKTGQVKQVRVVSGHPLLAEAAKLAVRQWTYAPTYHRGQAVEVSTSVTVSFRRPPRYWKRLA